MDFKLFEKLSSTPAACGREELLRETILPIIKPLVDEVRTDALGNIVALKKGKGKFKLMLDAHMDEVSARVRFIEDSGFLRFVTTGGIDARTLVAQRVKIQTKKHGILTGVIGSKPAHYLTAADLAKAASVDSLFIDTGLDGKTAKEVFSMGDPITLDRAPIEFGKDMFSAKAIDDRAGVYILLKVMENLPKEHDADIYFTFTTQEEFGLIGCQCAVFDIKPDAALAVDTTGALDTPGIPAQDFVLKLGQGIGISMVDRTTIANQGVVDHLVEICQKRKIPYQLRVASRGSNDGMIIQRHAGAVPECTLSVPVRYIHSNVEVANKNDVDAAVALVENFALECCPSRYTPEI